MAEVDTHNEVRVPAQSPGSPRAVTGSRVPPVAVCIPLYNKEAYIADTIRSVLAQTFTDFELIVLENASRDRSAEIVRSITDPRLTVVHNTETLPPTDNFAKAVSLSRAPLIKLLMADDLIHPKCLERQVEVLRRDPDLAMVSCRHDVIDDAGQLLAPDRALRNRDLVGRQRQQTVVRRVVRHGGNPIGNPGNVLFRRSAFDSAGGFAGEEFFTLDVSTWIRLLAHGGYYGMPETLTSFRVNSGSHTTELGVEAIRLQREFIGGLRAKHPDVIRGSDVAYGAVRAPLTRLRHHVIFAAAGAPNSLRRRIALKVLAAGGRSRAQAPAGQRVPGPGPGAPE